MSRNMLKLVIVVIFCIYINFRNAGNNAVVNISNGQIRGTTMKSRGGRIFFSFKGIPYAKPPIGNLRFKSPEEISNWQGTLDATEDAPACLQKDLIFHRYPEIEGSEDCLFLNVYTPTIESTKNLPVIVQIPYGGFTTGNSKSTLIGPQYLLDRDVVYVSFNYRLGIFGFYSTLDDASPGNYALKDQLFVLRWVQKNIANFGGNPNLVTIIGMSAGAGSVHNHLLSPASQGLFHRVIASSGTALNVWARPVNFIQESFFRAAAESVGCYGTTTDIIECMRKVSANDLLLIADKFRYYGDGMFIYGTYQCVLYHAYNGYKDLWMYNFEYKGEQSFRQSFASTNRSIDYDFGVSHGDDYIYLFPAPDIFPELPSSDTKMSEIMVEIWTYFAVHGKPPKLNDGSCTLDWNRISNIEGKTPIKNEYLNLLNITKSSEGDCPVSMQMQNGFLKDRMSFWKNLPVRFQIKDFNLE